MNIAEIHLIEEGDHVEINGWVANKRDSGKVAFFEIRDGSGFISAVLTPSDMGAEAFQNAVSLPTESSVCLSGTLAKHPKTGEFELHVSAIHIYQRALEYPIGKKDHGPEFLLDNRHIWLRSKRQWAIQRIRDRIIRSTYDFFAEHGFIKIDAPVLTPTSCEGTTELFAIDYFGEPAYLSQSGQLYLEAAIAAHGNVFDFGPVFRAEKSKTRRHLTEFWMMDAEMAFADHEENMRIQEALISKIVSDVLTRHASELRMLDRNTQPLETVVPPFDRLAYADAVAQLQSLGSDIKLGEDLGADDETILTKQYEKPLFVERYPAHIKAFYMKSDPQNPEYVLNNDLLAPEGYGEIIGGSQREDDYEALKNKMNSEHLPSRDFAWYLDTRAYGSVPHSGFGFGLERIVAWICGLNHVRETIPFPRMINRLRP